MGYGSNEFNVQSPTVAPQRSGTLQFFFFLFARHVLKPVFCLIGARVGKGYRSRRLSAVGQGESTCLAALTTVEVVVLYIRRAAALDAAVQVAFRKQRLETGFFTIFIVLMNRPGRPPCRRSATTPFPVLHFVDSRVETRRFQAKLQAQGLKPGGFKLWVNTELNLSQPPTSNALGSSFSFLTSMTHGRSAHGQGSLFFGKYR
jgi:hypothetical protein